MNGISLLLLLSTVGATTSVEMSATGQQVYTIRIESLLINELRAGQAVPIVVAPKDRRIRRFKIAIASDANQRSGSSTRTGDINSRTAEYDYEPTQLDNGEIEYAVQISPERLESLALGKAIEGEIAADIAEVHRFFIFVGVGQLPSQQQAAQQQAVKLAGNSNSPALLRGAEVRANPTSQTRNTNPGTQSQFQSGTQTTNPRYQAADPLTQFNSRTTDNRTNWRNHPDESTISPPPFTTATQPPSNSSPFPRNSGLPAATDRNVYGTQPNYTNPYPQQNYPEQNPAYTTQNPAGYPPQGYATNPNVPYQQQPPVATVAARNDVPAPANPAAPPNTNWAQPAPTTLAAAQPAASAIVTTPAKTEAESERPWTPLILTTLALFASLGTNAYLGWLAWSFFWRFRDAVTESARTRAQISSSRQAA